MMRGVLALCVVLLTGCAAPPPVCRLPGARPMQVIELYFGRDIAGRAPVTEAEWDDFLARNVTPRFADGFTVFDAKGQWMNPQTGVIGREASRMVQAAVPEGADVADRVAAVSDAYKTRFRQVAVGVVTYSACARF